MNTTLTPTYPVSRRVAAQASPQTAQLMTFSHQHNWDFLVLGQAPLPTQPVRLGDWQIVPVSQDSSQIPARTLERVKALYEAGLRPKGFVMVHEAPMLLSAPTTGRSAQPDHSQPVLSPKLKSLLATLAVSGIAVGLATLTMTVLAALFAVSVAAAAVDPILVAVTDDDYWVEIDRWWV